LKYPPEVKLAVFISHSPIQIYRILKVKKLALAKTMWYFFCKQKYLKKNFQPNRTRFKGISLWQDEKYGKPRFSLKKTMKTVSENFFLDYVSRHLRWSICDKNFNPIDLTTFEIWKSWKKRGDVSLTKQARTNLPMFNNVEIVFSKITNT
jgi:hypothetical protein